MDSRRPDAYLRGGKRRKEEILIFLAQTDEKTKEGLFVPLNSCRAGPRRVISAVVRAKKPLRQMFDRLRDAPEELVVFYCSMLV